MILKFIIIWVIVFIVLLIIVPIILYIATFFYHLLKGEEPKKKMKGTRYFHLKDLKIPKTRRKTR
ncbi:hypothetical protein KY335_04995 [Candidatus Woesearchaeota archaeon]|nr:hypothetical protein [Candidatus Woesearchaeota archaeon]MBW3014566.1 hypothetical protein [Candidatus Woesearchaeota archaeon]